MNHTHHKKKSDRQKVIIQCDNLFREIIRRRDKVCQRTGKTTNLQVAHFWTRGNLRVRWDPMNACLLNGGVHYYWAHVKHQEFREFWIKRIGQEEFDKLELRARYVSPVKLFDIQMIKAQLREQLQ